MRILLTFLSLLLFMQCSSSDRKEQQARLKEWMTPNGKVKVLATTSMIGDIVNQIGGDQVDTWVLIRNGLDPHSYQLVKGDDEKLASAQVIFASGLGLEHHPSIAHHLESKKAIQLGDRIMDAHPDWLIRVDETSDPHIWMDVSIWQQTVPIIVEALSQAAPSHAQLFQQRGKALEEEMTQTHREIQKELAEVPDEKRYLVSSHDAFNYFGRAYLASDKDLKDNSWEKRVIAPEGLAPESQLSPTHIQEILNHLKLHGIRVIFPETNVSKDSIRKILQAGKELGLEVHCSVDPLYADAMGDAGSDGDTYLKMAWHNAKTIKSNLSEQ